MDRLPTHCGKSLRWHFRQPAPRNLPLCGLTITLSLTFVEVFAICAETRDEAGFDSLLRDPLIRLVMKSDGVTEQKMIAVMDQLRRSLAAREGRLATSQSETEGSGPSAD